MDLEFFMDTYKNMSPPVYTVPYTNLTKLTSTLENEIETLKSAGQAVINLTAICNNEQHVIDSITVKISSDGKITYCRDSVYKSLPEISTLCMKEVLVKFAKQRAVEIDPEYFKEDDPRLHCYLAKLSYAGIEQVVKQLPAFLHQFKAHNITMAIPPKKSGQSKQGDSSVLIN